MVLIMAKSALSVREARIDVAEKFSALEQETEQIIESIRLELLAQNQELLNEESAALREEFASRHAAFERLISGESFFVVRIESADMRVQEPLINITTNAQEPLSLNFRRITSPFDPLFESVKRELIFLLNSAVADLSSNTGILVVYSYNPREIGWSENFLINEALDLFERERGALIARNEIFELE